MILMKEIVAGDQTSRYYDRRPQTNVINFTGFETGTVLDGWEVSNTAIVDDPVFSGSYALRLHGLGEDGCYFGLRGFADSGTSIYEDVYQMSSRFWFRHHVKPTGSEEMWSVWDIHDTECGALRLNSAGKIDFYDLTGTRLVKAGHTVLAADTWYEIFVYVRTESEYGRFNGQVILAINGSIEYLDNIVRSGYTAFGSSVLGNKAIRGDSEIDFYYDDFVVGRQQSYYTGGRIVLLKPNASGTWSQWTGTFADVDDVPHDSDGTTIHTNANFRIQTFNLVNPADLGIEAFDEIYAIKLSNICKFGVDSTAVTNVIETYGHNDRWISHGAGWQGTNSYLIQELPLEIDDITGSAWEFRYLQNLQIGLTSWIPLGQPTGKTISSTGLYCQILYRGSSVNSVC